MKVIKTFFNDILKSGKTEVLEWFSVNILLAKVLNIIIKS